MRTNHAYAHELQLLKPLGIVVAVALCLGGTAFAANNGQLCVNNSETRQLDYWLGTWTIGSGADQTVSRVSLSLDKCVFVEHWENGKGHVTEKMFAYTPEEKNWYGMFADNEGRVHVFLDGKVTPHAAEFHGPSLGPNGESVLNRLTITNISSDKLEEVWEKSTDKGSTWTIAYRAQYTRKLP